MVFSSSQGFGRSGDSIQPQGLASLAAFEDLLAPAEEQSVAGYLLISGSRSALEVFDETLPREFTDALAKAVMESAHRLFAAGGEISPQSVAQDMRMQNTYAEVGGASALTRLQALAALDLAEAVTAARAIREYANRRALYTLGRDVSGAVLQLGRPIEDALAALESGLMRLETSSNRAQLEPLSALAITSFSEIEQRSLGVLLPGLPCGFYDLDAMTQGFQRSDLVIAAGRPSMGKTAWLTGVSRGMAALNPGGMIAVYSLEMSKIQLFYRYLSAEVEMETSRLRSGRIAQNEWERLGHAISILSQLPIYVDDNPMITVAGIRSSARRLQAETGQPLTAIFIDYLQLMEGGGDNNRVQELSKITRRLKALARELNVPIFALSQLSRGVEGRTNKRPLMSDLRESGGIEQDADLILMLYRDEYYDPDTPDRGIAEVILVKHRNGPTGTIKLLFEPQFSRFRNLATPGGDPAAARPSLTVHGIPAPARPANTMSSLGQIATPAYQPPRPGEALELEPEPEGEGLATVVLGQGEAWPTLNLGPLESPVPVQEDGS